MFAACVGLTVVSGDSLLLEFEVTDDQGEVAIITGTTPEFVLVAARDPSDSLTVAGVITDGPNGLFRVTVTSAQTAGLSGVYRYQASLEDVSGDRQTVSRGTVNFVPSLGA